MVGILAAWIIMTFEVFAFALTHFGGNGATIITKEANVLLE